MGHRAGIKSVRVVAETARELGIEFLTLYAFSVENWKRTSQEIGLLMDLLNEYLSRELLNLMKNKIRLNVLGDMEGLPEKVQKNLNRVMQKTLQNDQMTLNLALNYGGRAEIVAAVRQAVREAAAGRLKETDVDEKRFAQWLTTKNQPDPDLLIRTSGEQRISNFLLWQISYTELYLTPVLWPDFGKEEFIKALQEFQRRERRFGA